MMPQRSITQRYVTAGFTCGLIAWVWLVVLPWIGRQSVVREHVDALHAANINASAMFYSELECQQWLQR